MWYTKSMSFFTYLSSSLFYFTFYFFVSRFFKFCWITSCASCGCFSVYWQNSSKAAQQIWTEFNNLFRWPPYCLIIIDRTGAPHLSFNAPIIVKHNKPTFALNANYKDTLKMITCGIDMWTSRYLHCNPTCYINMVLDVSILLTKTDIAATLCLHCVLTTMSRWHILYFLK